MKKTQNLSLRGVLTWLGEALWGASLAKPACLYSPASPGINCFFSRDYSTFSTIHLIFHFYDFLT